MEDCSVGYKTEISHYQREIATLRRHASLMHRRLEDTKRNVRNGVSAIAHVLNGNFSDTLRLQLKGVENLLSSLAAPRFKHRPETSHLDCGRLFSGDVIYTAEVAHSRIVMIENEDLDMSCDAIHSRIFLQPRVISSNYGIAFARIVHRKRAVDEMLMSTLQIADGWEMPGRFTDHCLKQGYSYEGITRMVQWSNDKADCLSGFLRHQVCILGIENLPSISTFPHILANKMMPSFDYGAIACLSELLFNRTYLGQNDHPLNISFYENLSAVRFHNDQRKHGIKPDCHNP
ncbi:hypothetical protein RB195_018983 [Necator americanus]|uniref:Uncharacterized protein n=1 Tax=Necator americanus TaxID=51031 RepID=A0ABR1CD85_NECAM